MLTWILTQPYQQDPKNVACVDLDFSLVDSSVNSQVIDGTRKHKVNGILTGVVLTVDAEIQRSGGGIDHAQWWSIISVSCLAWRLRFQEAVNLSGRLIGGGRGAIPCKSIPVLVLKFRFHLMPLIRCLEIS
jgi:hypothetical protein